MGKGKKSAKVTPVTLQEQIDALEGSFRSLKLEWTDTYDKLYRLAGRMDSAKRWAPPSTPPVATGEKGIVPENGSEREFSPPPEPAAPVRPQSRKDLLDQWTR